VSGPDFRRPAPAYAAGGWPIFPCGPDKRPLVPGGFHAATTDPEQVARWWNRWPWAWIGYAVREVVLDVDDPYAYGLALHDHGPHPRTWCAETPGRGGVPHFQLYFAPPAVGHVPQRTGWPRPGLDTRCPGLGYVILPPSPGYVWLARPSALPLAPCPSWLVEVQPPEPPEPPRPDPPPNGAGDARSRAWGEAILAGECRELAAMAPETGRNARLNDAGLTVARVVLGGYLDAERARAALREAARACRCPGAEATLRSGWDAAAQYGPRHPPWP
jgi:hypothetical protein